MHLDKNIQKDLDYQRKKLMHMAKKYAEVKKCKKCGADLKEHPRKVSALYEYGDPFVPSKVIIYCPRCKKCEVFAERPYEQAIAFARALKGEEAKLGKRSNDQLVKDAIREANKPVATKEQAEKAIKDEDNKIIASKEAVQKKDARRKN